MKLLIPFSLCILLSFCSTPIKEKETSVEEPADEPALTYMELYNLVIQETGQRIEWHGEELEKDATTFLTISEGEPCGENDCGRAMFLENTSEGTIHVVIQAPFQIEDVTSHLATQYSITGNSKISIGCSHLCYDGESFLFERRIVGAKEGGEPF
ncbi:MAG: hypothetical protein RIM99_05015 [Cyclobacteriaceae bacterium]